MENCDQDAVPPMSLPKQIRHEPAPGLTACITARLTELLTKLLTKPLTKSLKATFTVPLAMISVVIFSAKSHALAGPACFSAVSALKSNFASSPLLAKLKPLANATNFVGSVPVPVFGSTPADATIVYGADTITLSLHVEDPRPLHSDFRISNRPVSICADGDQFYFQDAANGKRFPFVVNGSNISIQKDNYILTMHPAGAGELNSSAKRGQSNKGDQ